MRYNVNDDIDCRVELKKQVLPVLRSPLYFGLASLVLGVAETDEAREECREEEDGAAERARPSEWEELEPCLLEDAEGVYG